MATFRIHIHSPASKKSQDKETNGLNSDEIDNTKVITSGLKATKKNNTTEESEA